MKFALFLMGALFIHSPVWAKGFIVNWACPTDSSEKISVEVSYDETGKLNFEPEIFSEIRKEKGIDYSKCIADFQQKISDGAQLFQEKKCPQSKDSFCAASIQYTNTKVLDKIRNSYFMKKFQDVRVLPLTVTSTPKAKEPTPPSDTPTKSVESTAASTPEAFLESMINAKVVNPKELNRIFTYQNKSYKVSDFDQVIAKNIDSMFSSMNAEEGKQFAQNYMVAKAEYLNEGSDSAKRKAVLDNLNQMFAKMYGSRGAEELAKMLECNPDDNLKPIDDIIKKLQDTQKIEGCKPLQAGQHKVFQKDNNNYYSTGDYLLKRKSDGTYQAFVNVDFQQARGKASSAEMMKRSKECLQQASPFLKGPGGERLEMMVFTPEEMAKFPKDEQPPRKVIKIEHSEFATNAANYADDVGCPTITHEMLHLLGLCDEYEETRPEYGNMWNCRVVPKATSIMRNHVDAWNKSVAQNVSCSCNNLPCTALQKSSDEDAKKLYIARSMYEFSDFKFRNKYCTTKELPYGKPITDPTRAAVVSANTASELVVESRYVSGAQKAPLYQIGRTEVRCKCPAGDAACQAEKNRIAAEIPRGGTRNDCPLNTVKQDKSKANLSGVLNFKSTPTAASLLHPNQFKKILAGNCPGIADGYLECAEFAYKGNASKNCNIPERCKDDKYYLGSEQ